MASISTRALRGADVVGSRSSAEKISNKAKSLPISYCPFLERKLSAHDVERYAADFK